MIGHSCPYTKCLHDNIQLRGLHLVPSAATYHQTTNQGIGPNKWLDLFIVHSASLITRFAKSEAPFTYSHGRIDLTVSLGCPADEDRTLVGRDFRRFDISRYSLDLHRTSINFSTIGDPKEMGTSFNGSNTSLLNKLA